jgi:hypothetical protein
MGRSSIHLAALEERLQPLRARLAEHPLYGSIQSIDDLHTFMESHVFAVWDFMSLLKSLQRGLTCVDVPWVPSAHAEARRLINEIVLGEESDQYEGRAASHFELYLEAMRECGASTAGIDDALAALRRGESVDQALSLPVVPEGARAFSRSTFSILQQNELHKAAAAFTFGREDLIPDMFRGLVRDLDRQLAGRLGRFVWYLERHIEVDGEEHGPMALRMVSALCGEDAGKWRDAGDAAEVSLEARLALWDGILRRLPVGVGRG